MEVTVTRERILVRYFPFVTKELTSAEISRAHARTYHPIKEYGGRLLIGSQKADEPESAITGLASASAP